MVYELTENITPSKLEDLSFSNCVVTVIGMWNTPVTDWSELYIVLKDTNLDIDKYVNAKLYLLQLNVWRISFYVPFIWFYLLKARSFCSRKSFHKKKGCASCLGTFLSYLWTTDVIIYVLQTFVKGPPYLNIINLNRRCKFIKKFNYLNSTGLNVLI